MTRARLPAATHGPCADLFDTRGEAQRLAAQFAATQRGRILAALFAAGSDGLTADELEVRLPMSGNSLRPRLLELSVAGEVLRDGRTRRTRSGHLALVFVHRGA